MDILHRVAVVIDERDHVVLVAKFALGHLAGIRLRRSMDFNNDVVNFTQIRLTGFEIHFGLDLAGEQTRGLHRDDLRVMVLRMCSI
jgi:hypothetical protein